MIQNGNEIAFWHESDEPATQTPIALPDDVVRWCVAEMGYDPAVRALVDWAPDLIYVHGLITPDLEARVLNIAPAIFFVHTYHGTCIGGSKTFSFPIVRPCERKFGWQCFAYYYPHRCGGWNPVTMWREYDRQASRLKLLSRYAAIITHSRHMVEEYRKYDFQVRQVPFCVTGFRHDYRENVRPLDTTKIDRCIRLLFSGRMVKVKGGEMLLNSLPRINQTLGLPLHVVFAGTGPMRRNGNVWPGK